jgi:D-alanyl-D-alanine carboxypeptidase/D-alanyl-D-alanine-endopeptidase (penicillin-binding protein 4)
MRAVIAALGLALLAVSATPAAATPAAARPAPVRGRPAVRKPALDGAHARVAINHAGVLRPAREAVGRREEPLTAEEETARQIEKLLRGPLRYGVTGLFVADARTGEALFAVNADDRLNPASNVKMISTATALELLGADFRYPTRLLGAPPDAGVVHGDVYLLGSHDPTLTIADLDDIAAAVAAGGITRIDGSIVVGADPTRDGIYRSILPIEIRGGELGAPVIATTPPGMDFITINMTATTVPIVKAARTRRLAKRPRLTYEIKTTRDDAGHPRVVVTIGGTIGEGGATTYWLFTRERTATAAYALRAALHARGVALAGDFKIAELGDFIGDAAVTGSIPIELGRHESPHLAKIIARINKRSINWLADRVIMTAAALVKQQPPSMKLALAAMYDWLNRHPRIAKSDFVVDTGSGLSFQSRITVHELVSIVRSAAGFTPNGDTALSHAWLDSLPIAGTDGTLSSRFRAGDVRGRMRGKTGTLATVIALSGVLDLDPQRPLAFSLVTNGHTRLAKGYVRRAHEQIVGLLCHYVTKTRKASPAATAATAATTAQIPPDASQAAPVPLQLTPASQAALVPLQLTPASPPLPQSRAGEPNQDDQDDQDEQESDPLADDETGGQP